MNGRTRLAAVVAVLALSGTAVAATAATGDRDDGNGMRFRAALTGYEEVPAISTAGRGRFQATLAGNAIRWRLEYAALEGGAVQQAHIHFGQPAVNGGVSAFLCSNLQGAPAGVRPCPQPPATTTGTIGPAQVVGPAGQGIAPGELDELVRAMRLGVTYANVHTDQYPNGEIRGQIRAQGGG